MYKKGFRVHNYPSNDIDRLIISLHNYYEWGNDSNVEIKWSFVGGEWSWETYKVDVGNVKPFNDFAKIAKKVGGQGPLEWIKYLRENKFPMLEIGLDWYTEEDVNLAGQYSMYEVTDGNGQVMSHIAGKNKILAWKEYKKNSLWSNETLKTYEIGLIDGVNAKQLKEKIDMLCVKLEGFKEYFYNL